MKSLSIDAVFVTAVVPSTDDDTPAWWSLILGIRHETTRTHRQRERAQVANLTHSPESRSPPDPTDREDTLAHRQQGTLRHSSSRPQEEEKGGVRKREVVYAEPLISTNVKKPMIAPH